MLPSDQEIFVASIVTATLMVFLVGVVGYAIFKYQRRMQVHLREITAMKAAYQQELLRSQLEIQEQTMQSVAQEIHDNVGQLLSLVKINLNTLPPTEDTKATEKLANSKDYLNRAIADLRGLSKSLNPENRLAAGLVAALGVELDAIRNTGLVETSLSQLGTEVRLDPRQELILFRITQETLNNALKHARAKNIRVSLDYSVGRLNLTVADDGVGFDTERVGTQTGGGSGLANIQNRAKLIGAEATIRSAVGEGTLTVLSLPIPPSLPH